MRIKLFFRTAAVALFFALASVAVSAQTVTITGKVMLKQADGTEVPVEGAVIDVYRTDISQKFQVKTNKKGEYTHAGIPFTGTYTIAVSAPGARPTYSAGLRLSQRPGNDFTLDPGDGSRMTLEQIKAMGGAAAPSVPGAPAAKSESAEDKAAREEMAKKIAEIEEKNKKALESNAIVKRTFDAGNAAYSAKNYDEAIRHYDEGLAADPEQAVFYLNKSLALRQRAVDNYNDAIKNKDNAKRDGAKADFKNAAEASDKAVQLYRTQQTSSPTATGAPVGAGAQPSELLTYLTARMENYRLAVQTSAGVTPENTLAAIEEYIAAEIDPAKKAKAEANLGQALFMSGRIDDSIAAYRKVLASNPSNLDAMFGLGIALAADPEGKFAAEARDLLKDFAAKAPATDSRKADAEGAAAALEDSLKPKQAEKSTTPARRRGKP